MNNQEEVYKDLFPALYKLEKIRQQLKNFDFFTDDPMTRREQNEIGNEIVDAIRDILAENLR